jgi:hypothetical protein
MADCIRPGGGSRPELLVVETQGVCAVVKDYMSSGWLLRSVVGPWLLDREERCYRALCGTPGVPRFVGRVDRWALAVEHIDGRSCAEFGKGDLPPEFFERLKRIVEGIHERGIVHCDIKNRSNIVVAEGFMPYIVDFASAFAREGCLMPLRRFVFERFRMDDLRGVAKARIHVGGQWTEADARFAFHRSPGERVIRAVRDAARWLFQLAARR